jgi:phytanoyl-CoA hydroxylase
MLSPQQVESFAVAGHLTVDGLFSASDISIAVNDTNEWGDEILAKMTPEEAQWYLEPGNADARRLRKMDNPVFHRPVFRQIASHRLLVEIVEQLIGPGLVAFFSQIFCKPPEVGGPKPVHQDNYYFGPEPADAMLTAWVALDDASIENGCLHYGKGSHLSGLFRHTAPDDRPFDLQVSPDDVARFEMTPAPVMRGGVSFHHGLTLHQSGQNKSPHPRRAVAIHYLKSTAKLVAPALEYDDSLFISIPT